MEEWKKHRIGDVCSSISDTYKGNAENVVLINTSDVLEGKCLNHQQTPNKNLKGQFKKTFQRNDILYSEIRPANKRYAFIDFEPVDYIASTKLMVIRHNEKILPQYLFYILKSQSVIDELQMLAESRSGTFPQITFSELAKMELLLPPIKQQNRILQILSSLDDKIEINRRINENLEQQAQALFKSWFVDFEPFRNQPFVESELGMIPEGWRVGILNDICKFENGFAFKSDTYTAKGMYRVVTIKNVQDGYLNTNGANLLSDIPDKMPDFCKLNVSDILISLTGNVGRCCLVAENDLLLNQRVAKIRPREKDDWGFVYTLFRLSDFKDRLISIARGTAQANLSPVEASKLPIIIPPKNTMKQYSLLTTDVYHKIIYCMQESRCLAELRDTLLPRLMSGELKVNEIEQ